MLSTQVRSPVSMKLPRKILVICLLSLATLTTLSGCRTADVNPDRPEANTGYVDFYAPGQSDLYWEVKQYDPNKGAFKTVFSRAKPLDGPFLRLATPPGRHQFRVTFLNRVVMEPAVVDVQVTSGMITPVRVELVDVGSTQVERREARLGLTVRRFGPGARVTSYPTDAHDVLATPQPAVPYQKKELARYPS
ncbi:MAG: hypothetical protein JWR69_3815 [Pedosphaera sp.]|nr:hypothetical protein [Pedosphaera sp.]